MGVGFFGLNSIITLMAIACERYIVITAKPAAAKWRITRRQAKKVNKALNHDVLGIAPKLIFSVNVMG